MFVPEIMNTSVGINNILLNATDALAPMVFGLLPNNEGVHHKYDSRFREWLLITMVLFNGFGHTTIWLLGMSFYKIRRLLNTVTLIIILNTCLIVVVPMFAQVSYESEYYFPTFFWRMFSCEGIKNVRNYFLTLYSYTLVVVVVNCYSVVVKPISIFSEKCHSVLIGFGFYALCYLPALLIDWARNDLDGGFPTCAPYFFHATPFKKNTGPYSMALTLMLIYIIPMAVILLFLYKITIKTRPKYNSLFDMIGCLRNIIRIPFALSIAYIFSNAPFVIQAIITTYIDPNFIDFNVVRIIEIVSCSSICINPYLFLFQFLDRCFPYKSNNNDTESTLTSMNAVEDSKLVDKCGEIEAVRMPLKA